MDPNHNTETPPLSEAAVKFNSVLTFAQGFALVAIAVAALVGICSSIWSMVELEKPASATCSCSFSTSRFFPW